MNVVPRPPTKRPSITLKELEDYDAPKAWYGRVFRKVFNFVMRRRIEEMVWESNMEEDELRVHKRTRELKHVRRRLVYHIVYLAFVPLAGVLSLHGAGVRLLAGDRWGFFWLGMAFLWFRQLPKDWRARQELAKRRMELLVEEVHDL
jgi:hypothetical protein